MHATENWKLSKNEVVDFSIDLSKMLRVWAKKHEMDMKFLRKFLNFTLENLNGKLIC